MTTVSLRKCQFVAALLLAASSAWAQGDRGGLQTASVGGKEARVITRAELNGELAQPVPADAPVRHIQVARGQSTVTAGAARRIYQNTLFTVFLPGGTNQVVADDVETTAADGGMMSFFEIAVFGQTGGGLAPTYNLSQLKLFNGCPGEGGVEILDFLEGEPIEIPERGSVFMVTFDLVGAEVAIPERFWIGMAFDAPSAGWVGGAPPQIGFSEDLLFTPVAACQTVFTGNPGPYGAMYADISAIGTDPFFTAYEAATFTSPQPLFDGGAGCNNGIPGLDGCGDGVNTSHPCESFSDDVRLIVNDCELHSISVKFAGVSPPSETNVELELWTDNNGLPGVPIPGTRGCGEYASDGFLRKVFFDYPRGIMLPRKLWVVFMDNSGISGPIIAGSPAEVGDSANYIAVFDRSAGVWEPIPFDGNCPIGGGIPCGIYLLSLQCIGEEPLGACCDRASGTCGENTRVRSCEGEWEPESTCANAAFEVPCGEAACCQVQQENPDATFCSNKTPQDCVADGGEPADGGFDCNQPAAQDCGLAACVGASGSCNEPHGGLGCDDVTCCTLICEFDEFCCTVMFDEFCQGIAEGFAECSLIPPANNRCFDAAPIAVGTTPFTTVNASRDGPPLPIECESFGSTSILHDVWFKFTSPGTGILTIDLCGSNDGLDTRIAVYEGGTCPPLSLVDCNDDGCGATALTSRLEVPVSGSTVYLIRVGMFADETGAGVIELSLDAQSCPDIDPTVFVEPASSVIDARQPYLLTNAATLQGIQTFTIEGTPGAADTCFTECETLADPSPNNVASVTEGAAGVYTLVLDRPITTGAVTTINYNGTNRTDRGVFTSHPGNVNGDGIAEAADLTALTNCLYGVNIAGNCPHGLLSMDTDRSGQLNASDLTRLVELLVGAHAYDPWLGTPRPTDVGCP